MSPTRRDTLKAAGAASGLAMLGGHAVAQQGTPGSDDDNPGAQTLEEGEAGVRVGHFVSGAPAVNVRLVPMDGGGMDTENGTDTGNETGGNVTDDNTTVGNDSDDNTTLGNDSDNTSEDLQLENDSNETNDTDDGLLGNDSNATNDTDDMPSGGTTDGEGELIAENVSFGEVSEYANVEAGDYTVQIFEYVEETTDEPTGTGNATDNATDNGTDNASEDDPIISLPDDLTGNDSDNETGGNTSDNTTLGNDSDNTTLGNDSDNTSEDLQLENDSNETNDTDDGLFGNDTNETNDTNATNDTDDMPTGGDTATDGEMLYEQDITVGESYYTVAAVGTADDIQAMLLQDYDAAQVRLVHASPDAPAVDVVAPDATMTLFDGVTFGQATEYVGVPPGSYSLSVREEADMNDGDEIATSDVEVEAGEAYSIYAVGSPEGGEEEFQLVVNKDGQGADAGLGTEGAPGQQGDGPGQGNQTNQSGGPGGDGPPGQDNDSDSPGQSGNAGGGPGADDEPGSSGGAAGPNEPGHNETGNASGD